MGDLYITTFKSTYAAAKAPGTSVGWMMPLTRETIS